MEIRFFVISDNIVADNSLNECQIMLPYNWVSPQIQLQ